ncbi:hypothetical protein HS3_00450 [Bacillus subtilis]|nr:hypothetical protein HS3_00450 [Bacillus subtilis]
MIHIDVTSFINVTFPEMKLKHTENTLGIIFCFKNRCFCSLAYISYDME